jgi:hypothetical protein
MGKINIEKQHIPNLVQAFFPGKWWVLIADRQMSLV